jgi:hypothetical protein
MPPIPPSPITPVTRTPVTIMPPIPPSPITPVTRTPITIITIGVGVVAIRIRVISWWRRFNYRGRDDRGEERPPGGQNDLSRSCAGYQDKDQQ